MLRLKKVLAILSVTLFASGGVVALLGWEIHYVEGRPWDSGRVDVDGNEKEYPVHEKGASFSLGGGGEIESREGGLFELERVFMEFISTLESR